MFEKIKAWIKRKRETAREQQAADRLIKHIEQALGFELYEWQRLYIITGICSRQRDGYTEERQHIYCGYY